MDAHKKFEGKHSDLTGKILGAFFQLQKELGFGFSEKVYESALGETSVTVYSVSVKSVREASVYRKNMIL